MNILDEILHIPEEKNLHENQCHWHLKKVCHLYYNVEPIRAVK